MSGPTGRCCSSAASAQAASTTSRREPTSTSPAPPTDESHKPLRLAVARRARHPQRLPLGGPVRDLPPHQTMAANPRQPVRLAPPKSTLERFHAMAYVGFSKLKGQLAGK